PANSGISCTREVDSETASPAQPLLRRYRRGLSRSPPTSLSPLEQGAADVEDEEGGRHGRQGRIGERGAKQSLRPWTEVAHPREARERAEPDRARQSGKGGRGDGVRAEHDGAQT